jgi:hypothetical protein
MFNPLSRFKRKRRKIDSVHCVVCDKEFKPEDMKKHLHWEHNKNETTT